MFDSHRAPPAQAPRPSQIARGADKVHATGMALSTPRPAATGPSAAGAGMPEYLRASLDVAFETDLSAVRIHEDQQAPSLGALAFTRGTDVHFAPGRFEPETARGRALLGHELAHVVQQAEGRVTTSSAPQTTAGEAGEDSALEREADEAGTRVARGEHASIGRPARALGEPATAPMTQYKTAIKTGDLTTSGFTDWSYVAYLGQGLIRLRFCRRSDCEQKGEAIGTIGWVTNNPTHLDVSDDPTKPAANAPRAAGGAFKSSETQSDATNRFSRFAIFADAGTGLAAVVAVWKAFYEGQKKSNPGVSLAEIIKLHKGLEPAEKAKLDGITDPVARKAVDPREEHLALTRQFMIEAVTMGTAPVSTAEATTAVDQVLATRFSDFLNGDPDEMLNAARLFNLLGTLQAVARTEGSAKPSGVVYRCDSDAFERDPLTSYTTMNQRRITALEGSAGVKAELRALLGCVK